MYIMLLNQAKQWGSIWSWSLSFQNYRNGEIILIKNDGNLPKFSKEQRVCCGPSSQITYSVSPDSSIDIIL